jgi:hypothetical protein
MTLKLIEDLALLHLPRHRSMLVSRARMRVLQSLPAPLRRALLGGTHRYCTVCDTSLRRFLPFGPIEDEWCPVCASMSRHRLLWHALRRTDLFDGARRRVLHLAPEPGLERELRRHDTLAYTTADLSDPHVDDRVDITDMPYGDSEFDMVVCSHVLEHVPDDRAAMREIARVLRPGGTAVVMVPFHDDEVTDEDPDLTDAGEREARFGQHDHVRYYGRDIVGRLEAAGLGVHAVRADDLLSPAQLTREAVSAGETVFMCTSP